VQGKHKKTDRWSGQYGDVHIKFSRPSQQDDLEFTESLFGGSIPKNYVPGVKKVLKNPWTRGLGRMQGSWSKGRPL
jgi:elongation factor G